MTRVVNFLCDTLLNVLSRLAEAEFHLSQLNSRLEEERSRREVAEEAMRLTEQRVKRYKRYVYLFTFLKVHNINHRTSGVHWSPLKLENEQISVKMLAQYVYDLLREHPTQSYMSRMSDLACWNSSIGRPTFSVNWKWNKSDFTRRCEIKMGKM